MNLYRTPDYFCITTCMLIVCVLQHTSQVRLFAQQPNILLIMADDLGYGDLSCFGATDLASPNIDKLIGQGIRFTNFYSNCPVCSPTRAATITGRYPDLVGVPGVIRTKARDNWGYLSPTAITLPGLLRKAGYQTALIGKWHLGLRPENHPRNRGFDFFHGFLGDMMDDYFTHRRHGIDYMQRDFEQIRPTGHATDLFTEWTIDYIREHRSNEAPWFVFLAYNAPHTPIQPPDDWFTKVKRRQPEISNKRAKLVALIEHMDHGIGRIIGALDEMNMADNTLIIFVSDNGGQLSVGGNCGPLRGGKQDMYEGGIRVPAGARWPGRIKPGAESDHVLLTMDILPTLCEIAGVQIRHTIDGVSFLETLDGKASDTASRTLFFVRREGGRYMGQDYYAVRHGDWKLVHNNPHAPLELYNLGSDPAETTNLASQEQVVYSRLTQALRAHTQQAGRVPWQAPW